MSVSKKNSPLLLENWCPRKLKPLVSYRPFSSHCQKSNIAPGMGRHALSMTRPVKRMRGAFIFVSTRFTRSGDWGLKKGPSNWEGVCFSQTGRTNCCANDFRLVKIAAGYQAERNDKSGTALQNITARNYYFLQYLLR